MEIIKNLVIDSLNGLSLKDLPLFLLQLVSAGVLASVFQFVVNKKLGDKIVHHAVLTAISIALIASIVKYSLPFAVLTLPLIVWLKPQIEESKISKISLFIVGLIGVGCGVGSIIQTAIGLLVLCGIFILTPVTTNE